VITFGADKNFHHRGAEGTESREHKAKIFVAERKDGPHGVTNASSSDFLPLSALCASVVKIFFCSSELHLAIIFGLEIVILSGIGEEDEV
jgi:hypothetical protein